MISESSSKVQPRHLKRNAFLYVRQSTLRQVFENTESTKRQYDLRQRAISLGWQVDQIIVIDSDLGQSGASAADREGFQRLVSEISMGRAGIVMGLEVSRLARNNTDWHRLLEICAHWDTLILDEDGVYDPAYFNDRLLLGLKGTMSEAELHILSARLRGGILNKAQRGELEVRLPIGFVYGSDGKVKFDPDVRIQESIRQLFKTFRRTGSASATVKEFRKKGLQFPRRVYKYGKSGEVVWGKLEHSRVLWMLHNPRYAGAFFFGRSRQRRLPDGKVTFQRLEHGEWIALIRDAHEAYISWEDFEENETRLQENAHAIGADRERGAPREGPALLQGIAICAKCGQRMTVRYHQNLKRRVPDYVCQRDGIQSGASRCQELKGAALDDAVGDLLIQTVTPLTLEVALSVQHEIERRCNEVDHLQQKEVEAARYQANLARRRFMQCDPDNRLVANSLEAEWNKALHALADAQDRYEKGRESGRAGLTEEQRAQILGLARDFPRLWQDPRTPDRERKRMARLLIADVTILKSDDIRAQVRFNGGATHTLHVPLPQPGWVARQTPNSVVAEIDRLLEDYIPRQIANILNEKGMKSGEGRPFNDTIVTRICDSYGLKSRYARLRARKLLTLPEIARRLGVAVDTIKSWRRAGLLAAHAYDGRSYLFEPPGPDAPVKHQHDAAKRVGRSATCK